MLWNPRVNQWWNAPPNKMFEAYYMTLRVHYGMGAQDAFRTAKANKECLGLDEPGGIVGKIKRALGH